MKESSKDLTGNAGTVDLGLLMERIEKPLRGWLIQKVRAADVDDLFQDVCLKVLRSVGDLKESGSLLPWVYAITNSHIKDYYRRSRSDRTTAVEDWEAVVDLHGCRRNPEERLCAAQIRKYIRTFDGASHDVAVLHFVMGWPPREICNSMALNIHTVKSHIQRVKSRILANLAA